MALEETGAAGGGNAGHVDEILEGQGDAVERAQVVAAGNGLFRRGGCGAGPVRHHLDVGGEARVEIVDAVEVVAGQLQGRQLALLEPGGQFGNGGKGE